MRVKDAGTATIVTRLREHKYSDECMYTKGLPSYELSTKRTASPQPSPKKKGNKRKQEVRTRNPKMRQRSCMRNGRY